MASGAQGRASVGRLAGLQVRKEVYCANDDRSFLKASVAWQTGLR